MKEKIVMFIIGALVGAIITTGVFLIIRQNNTNQISGGPGSMQMQGGPNGEDGQPPELPDGETPSGAPNQNAENTNTSTNTNTETTTESNS